MESLKNRLRKLEVLRRMKVPEDFVEELALFLVDRAEEKLTPEERVTWFSLWTRVLGTEVAPHIMVYKGEEPPDDYPRDRITRTECTRSEHVVSEFWRRGWSVDVKLKKLGLQGDVKPHLKRLTLTEMASLEGLVKAMATHLDTPHGKDFDEHKGRLWTQLTEKYREQLESEG